MINLEAERRIILLLDPAELLTRAERGLLDNLKSGAQAPGDQGPGRRRFRSGAQAAGPRARRRADFEVHFARNGLEALGKLATFKPDVVTLDVHMPEMDGLACLDRIMVERPCPWSWSRR